MKKSLLVLLIFSAVLVSACGEDNTHPNAPHNITVEPMFAINGANWNDYVQGGNITNATDTACNADTDTACVHAGELRVMDVPGLSSCSGVTAADSLGSFEWICDGSTDPARVISNGLASGYGLANLIDFESPGWKDNSVSIYRNGLLYGLSDSTSWWDNPVVSNTTGGSLNEPGTVYVVTADTTVMDADTTVVTAVRTADYSIIANSVSLVSAPGVVIKGFNAIHLIDARRIDFIWIEGMALESIHSYYEGIFWETVRFSTMRNITVKNLDLSGIDAGGVHIIFSSYNRLENITVRDVPFIGFGIILEMSSYNTLLDVKTYNDMRTGIGLRLSPYNKISGVHSSANVVGIALLDSSYNTLSDVNISDSSTGIVMGTSHNNTLSDITTSNNGSLGLIMDNSSNNIFLNMTSANTLQPLQLQHFTSGIRGGSGIVLYKSSGNTLSRVSSVNNAEHGINLSSFSDNNTLSDVTAANNTESGIFISNSSDNYFTGLLKVGNNATGNCSLGVINSSPGLSDKTCTEAGITGSDTYGMGNTSDALLTNSVTIATSFVANITSDDTVNSSDIDGSAFYDNITDWTNFSNPYRGWGIWNADASPSMHQGPCRTGQTCQIWDWSLLATDTVLRNSLSLPAGDETLTHTWGDGSTSTLLRNAVEIQDDGIGNDNTLCESGETCLYTPNMGSYQGHGNLVSAGYIGYGATLENITLMKYETNGY